VSNPEEKGRLAGVDFGTVRIGIAVSDYDQRLASPFENYTCRGEAADRAYFCRLADDERIERFVVGLPVHMSGNESAKSLEARRFGEWLTKVTGRPVEFFDERYTSSEAERMLLEMRVTKKKRKEKLDKLAAQILLTSYLESQSRSDPPASLEG
jgi:putative holliday junction resolvase